MKTLVVIQARVSSSRLPAKVLLPVAGLPVAVLCARRAANRGLPVCVATSVDSTDDVLHEILLRASIPCVRGSLEDVLQRFVLATAELEPGALVVRLTADNVVPDGEFIAQLLADFLKRGRGYLGTHSPLDGLPYGVSAEVFTVDLLREADRLATTAYDREHVTPWIRRKTGAPVFRPSLPADWSHLRTTMDTPEDYQRILRIFRDEPDPIQVPWRVLCERVEQEHSATYRIPYTVKRDRILSRMTLGTAQLGLEHYGIANTTGLPDADAAADLVRSAVWHGVTAIDTAHAYGTAEARVGQALVALPPGLAYVVTKLSPMKWLDEGASDEVVRAAVEHSVFVSCHSLRCRSLEVLMLHRAEHLRSHGGRIRSLLTELKQRGLIRELGVSVYNPEQALEALQDAEMLHLQIPTNLLDRRWDRAGVPAALAQRPEVTVYTRSAFLQGALLLPPERWPQVAAGRAHAWCAQLDRLVAELGRQGRADLCIAYVLAQPWIDSVVLGVETAAQLQANLQLVRQPPLAADALRAIATAFADVPDTVLNPSLW
jgi:spore coat polysaccharide biosynthesis protein SpsF